MAVIRPFEVGYCTHPACVALRGAGLATRKFPARAYLLETRSGPYLWDTGYAEQFYEQATGIYRLYRWVTPVYYEHGQAHLIQQLAAHGVRAADLRAILISHFHADHIAGLADYPDVPLYASHEAVAAVIGLTGWRALRKAFIPGLLPADAESRLHYFEAKAPKSLPAALHPFQFGWPIDPHEELWVVPLPGHAEGHVGLFVQTPSGWALLAADAAWAPEAYQSLRGPSELSFLIQHNRKAYYDTLHKLHQLHHEARIPIHLSHEPSLSP